MGTQGITGSVRIKLSRKYVVVCVKVDDHEYIGTDNSDTFYTYLRYRYEKNGSFEFNTLKLLDDCQRQLKEEDNDQFKDLYDIFWNETKLEKTSIDNEYLEYVRPYYMGPWCIWHFQNPFSLKTKDGKLLYLEHKRQIHDERCKLLTMGYTRAMQKKYKLELPMPIKFIIKSYLNRNDTKFEMWLNYSQQTKTK